MTDASKPSSNTSNHLSYQDAGVSIDAGNQLVEQIKSVTAKTKRPEVLGGLGGFGALCEIPEGYKKPVLVSGTDGVGTKLKLAMDLNKHDTIGIDLVAMCVNDLIVCGAEPLYFLDYYATGKLDVEAATQVVTGIAEGCLQSGCSLVGGETAEMPGMYQGSDYDLAGFCTGVVEKEDILDGSQVAPGDTLVGMPSSGPHSNGYSLIRKILEVAKADLNEDFDGRSLGEVLLAPTRIYVKPILAALKAKQIKAMAHITGGGFVENIPRVLPESAQAVVDVTAWQRPAIFDWLQAQGNVTNLEMHRTFNCGVGMVLVTDQPEALIETLKAQGEEAFVMGTIEQSSEGPAVVLNGIEDSSEENA